MCARKRRKLSLLSKFFILIFIEFKINVSAKNVDFCEMFDKRPVPFSSILSHDYKLSITTKDYHKIRYWHTNPQKYKLKKKSNEQKILVPCILPNALLQLKIKAPVNQLTQFALQISSKNSGLEAHFQNLDRRLKMITCKVDNDTILISKPNDNEFTLDYQAPTHRIRDSITFTAIFVGKNGHRQKLNLSISPCKSDSYLTISEEKKHKIMTTRMESVEIISTTEFRRDYRHFTESVNHNHEKIHPKPRKYQQSFIVRFQTYRKIDITVPRCLKPLAIQNFISFILPQFNSVGNYSCAGNTGKLFYHTIYQRELAYFCGG